MDNDEKQDDHHALDAETSRKGKRKRSPKIFFDEHDNNPYTNRYNKEHNRRRSEPPPASLSSVIRSESAVEQAASKNFKRDKYCPTSLLHYNVLGTQTEEVEMETKQQVEEIDNNNKKETAKAVGSVCDKTTRTVKWTPKEHKKLVSGEIARYGKDYENLIALLKKSRTRRSIIGNLNSNLAKLEQESNEYYNKYTDVVDSNVEYVDVAVDAVAARIVVEDEHDANNNNKHDRKSIVCSNRIKWTQKENKTLIRGIVRYGEDYKKLNALVPSRTEMSIRLHVRRYYSKKLLEGRKNAEGRDNDTKRSSFHLPVVESKFITKGGKITEAFSQEDMVFDFGRGTCSMPPSSTLSMIKDAKRIRVTVGGMVIIRSLPLPPVFEQCLEIIEEEPEITENDNENNREQQQEQMLLLGQNDVANNKELQTITSSTTIPTTNNSRIVSIPTTGNASDSTRDRRNKNPTTLAVFGKIDATCTPTADTSIAAIASASAPYPYNTYDNMNVNASTNTTLIGTRVETDSCIRRQQKCREDKLLRRHLEEEEKQRCPLAQQNAEERARQQQSAMQQKQQHEQQQQASSQQSQIELILMERICTILENLWGRAELVSILTTLHSEDIRVIPLLGDIESIRALIARSPQRVSIQRGSELGCEMAVLVLTNEQWHEQKQHQARIEQEELLRRQMEEEVETRMEAQNRLITFIRQDDHWYYSDLQNNIQGPFRGEKMRQWLEVGYFKGDLPISQFPSGPFHQLCNWFPDLDSAFRVQTQEGQGNRSIDMEEQLREEADAATAAERKSLAQETAAAAQKEAKEKADATPRKLERLELEKVNNANVKELQETPKDSGNQSSTQLNMTSSSKEEKKNGHLLHYDVIFHTKYLGLGLKTSKTMITKSFKYGVIGVCGSCGGCSRSAKPHIAIVGLIKYVKNDEHRNTIYPGDMLISVGNTHLINNVSSLEDIIQIVTSYSTRPLTIRFARRRKSNYDNHQQRDEISMLPHSDGWCSRGDGIDVAKDDNESTKKERNDHTFCYNVVFHTHKLGLDITTTKTKTTICKDVNISKTSKNNGIIGVVVKVTNDDHTNNICPGDALLSVGNTKLINNVSSVKDIIQIITSYSMRPLTIRFGRRRNRNDHYHQQQQIDDIYALPQSDDRGRACGCGDIIDLVKDDDGFTTTTITTTSKSAINTTTTSTFVGAHDEVSKNDESTTQLDKDRCLDREILFEGDTNDGDDAGDALNKSRYDNDAIALDTVAKKKNLLEAKIDYVDNGTGGKQIKENDSYPKSISLSTVVNPQYDVTQNSKDQMNSTLGRTVIDLLSEDEDADKDKDEADHLKLQISLHSEAHGPSQTDSTIFGHATDTINQTILIKGNAGMKQNISPRDRKTDNLKKQQEGISPSFVIDLLEEGEKNEKDQLVLKPQVSSIDKGEDEKEDENLEDDGIIIIGSSAEPIDIDLLEVQNGHKIKQTVGLLEDDDEIQITGSTGKNALSDFPHARHLCLVKPFTKNQEEFCPNCYCYICDIKVSECSEWEDFHCKADSDIKWHRRRSKIRNKRKAPQRALQRLASTLLDPETNNNDTSTTHVSSRRRARRLNASSTNT